MMIKSNSNNGILFDMAKKPLLLVLSGPSGAGKDAVLSLLKTIHFPVAHIVTMTTRPRRPNEKDNIDYHFVSREQFQQLIDRGELLEWANVYGNFYGVPRQPVRQALDEGKDTIIKIDVQGATTIKKNVPQAVFIFLVPQTIQELIDRLTRRNTESAENLRLRIATAEEEMKRIDIFDYIAINEHGQIDRVVSEIKAIITAEKMRVISREYNI
jgi:guanylate kinase